MKKPLTTTTLTNSKNRCEDDIDDIWFIVKNAIQVTWIEWNPKLVGQVLFVYQTEA